MALDFTPANDSRAPDSENISESILDTLYTGKKLISFTKKAVAYWLFTEVEKEFIDEMCWRFGSFDAIQERKYSLIDIKRLSLQILRKSKEQASLLREAFSLEEQGFEKGNTWDVYLAFKDIFQADIVEYAKWAWIQSSTIRALVWELSELTLEIIEERK